jgi:hypothetical protein
MAPWRPAPEQVRRPLASSLASGVGTQVDFAWSFDLGAFAIFGPLLKAIFARGFRRDLVQLKTLMESGAL